MLALRAGAICMSYQNIIISISDTFSFQHLEGSGMESPNSRTIATEIIACQRNMPDYLRLPIRLMTWLFDWSAVLGSGRRFHKLDQAKKLEKLQSWRRSGVGSCRNFVRFYESLFFLIALQEDDR
jgi:hypothetical protein